MMIVHMAKSSVLMHTLWGVWRSASQLFAVNLTFEKQTMASVFEGIEDYEVREVE